MKVMSADVNALKAKDAEKDEQITHLKTQIDIYRRDFEMERADREKNAGEKEQYLIDLRALQRRNQELIEALAEAQKPNKFSCGPSRSPTSSLRQEQRPVRVCNDNHYIYLYIMLIHFFYSGLRSNRCSCQDSGSCIAMSDLLKTICRIICFTKSC